MKIADVKALLNNIQDPEDPDLAALRKDGRKGVQALIRQWEKKQIKLEAGRKQYEEIQSFERSLRLSGYRLIAGVDEVGRGPLAGPVTAACVILPESPDLKGLTDSKNYPRQNVISMQRRFKKWRSQLRRVKLPRRKLTD